MNRFTFILCATLFACVGLFAQQVAYSFPYQPIPASTVPVAPTATQARPMVPASNTLPQGYSPVVNYPAMPQMPQMQAAPALPAAVASVNSTRPLAPGAASEIGTIIPLTLPGYELRVMDVTKRVTFDVGGNPVSAEMPIFVYLPRNTQSVAESAKDLRKLYNDLIMLYDQDRIDKDRVHSMLQRLDGIIDTFDAMTPTVSRHSAVVTY